MPQQAVLVAFLHRNIRGHRKGFFWVSSNTVLKCSKSRDHLVSFQNFCALAYSFPSKTKMHLHTTHPQTVAALLYLPQHPMKYSMQSVHMQIKTLYSIYSYFGNPLVPAGLTQSGNPASMVGKDLLVFEILIYGICFANEGNLFSVFSGIHGGSSSAMGS